MLSRKVSVVSSLWETFSSLLGHRSDNMLRTTSTRTLTCLWWMFALLMVSCYTANLSAFLTIQRMDLSFSRPEDLVNHPEIRCGAVKRGATNNFIRNRDF